MRTVWISQCAMPRYPYIILNEHMESVRQISANGDIHPMYCTSWSQALRKAEWVARSTPRNSRILYEHTKGVRTVPSDR